MPRYVVSVVDTDTNSHWLGIVEADRELEALYQYPGYAKMFKFDYFMSYETVETWNKVYSDYARVTLLDELLGNFLST